MVEIIFLFLGMIISGIIFTIQTVNYLENNDLNDIEIE